MKLPILSVKTMIKLKAIKNNFMNKGRKNNLLNNFLVPNHNISSILSENQIKWEMFNQECRKTQRYRSNINNYLEKQKVLSKTKRTFFNYKNNNNYLNSFYSKSTVKNTNYSNNKTDIGPDNNNYNYENYEKYIRNTMSSFKIKKEISSYLYSSPEKQQRFINYLSSKFNKINNNKSKAFKKINKKIKVFRRIIIKGDSNNELLFDNKDDKDEDRTNLKEFSLLPLKAYNKININFIPSKIQKYKGKKSQRYIECWDNNLLKNILPRNLKHQSEPNKNECNIPTNGANTLNLNSLMYNNNISMIKYYQSFNSNRVSMNKSFKGRENNLTKRKNRNSNIF